jgi:serine/threonine protein kinase
VRSITLPIGTELGGYVLAGVLGSGASGTVYRARDADGLAVALKLLHPSVAADVASRRRLRREVKAQRAIRSPFVAGVVDAELEGAEAFVVTELIEGTSLARDIAQNGPWEPADLAVLARDLAGALDAVHNAGVLHRDVKPANVVISKQGRPVLIDFGIAQDSEDGRLTAVGLVAGTPGFVSPDLLRGADPSAASDHWAAAALLLNAATGRQPFGTGTVEAVLARVLDGLADLDGLPEPIARAFERALTPDAASRLTLAQLADALDPAAANPLDPDLEPTAAPTEALLPPTRLAALEPWTEPVAPPWRSPRRVDYQTWLEDRRASQAVVPSYPPGSVPAQAPAPDAVTPPQPYPSPPAPLRILTIGTWAVAGALALYWPLAVSIVGAVCLVVARTVWVAIESITARRYRRGRRPSDHTRTALGVPWYFLRGLGGSLAALTLAGLLGWAGYMVATRVAGAPETETAAASVAAGLLLAWWGPSSEETRSGERAILRAVLAPRWARWLTALATWLAAAGLIALRLTHL